jgi:hypothetical protein
MAVFLSSSCTLCLCGEFFASLQHISGGPREASFALAERCRMAARRVHPIAVATPMGPLAFFAIAALMAGSF